MSNGNEPTYPTLDRYGIADCVKYYQVIGGLTKREVFAMAAMQGLAANADVAWQPTVGQQQDGITWAHLLAKDAVHAADALLAELAK